MSDVRPKRLTATERTTLLIALVPYLVNNPDVPVADVAEQFDVAPATIADCVRTLAVSGIPGESGAYLHDDLFDIDWDLLENEQRVLLTHHVAIDSVPKLSGREAAIVLVGLNSLAAVLPEAEAAIARTAADKLLSTTNPGRATSLVIADDRFSDELKLLQRAIKSNHPVSFTYTDAKSQTTRRLVRPLKVESFESLWYLFAQSMDSTMARRTFRLERMAHLEEAEHPVVIDVESLGTESLVPAAGVEQGSDSGSDIDSRSASDVTANSVPGPVHTTLRILDRRGRSLVEWFDRDSAASGENLRYPCTIEADVGSLAALVRHVASLEGSVVVEAPPASRSAVAEWARTALARYDAAE